MSLVALASASAYAQSPNLLVNGDFDAGVTGFTSAYTYSPGNVYAAGTYDVVSNPRDSHRLAASFPDHTSGHGLMLVLNGSSDTSLAMWSEVVSVKTNTTYAFSGWTATWGHVVGGDYDESPPLVLIFVNGVQQGGAVQTISKNGQWQNFTALWDSQSSTQAVIQVRDANPAEGGNDLALDDLRFLQLKTNRLVNVAIYRSVEISWESVSNQQYQAQWAPALSANTWFDLGPAVRAQGTNSSAYDRVLMWDNRFYRVLSFE